MSRESTGDWAIIGVVPDPHHVSGTWTIPLTMQLAQRSSESRSKIPTAVPFVQNNLTEHKAPPSIPAPPAWSAGVPGAPPTSPLVSPHGTLPRYFGTRATRHAQCRLACDRPSPPVAPALPRKDDRGGTTAGTTGIKATTTDSKAKPPNDPILQLRHRSAAQPVPRPLPAGVPWV